MQEVLRLSTVECFSRIGCKVVCLYRWGRCLLQVGVSCNNLIKQLSVVCHDISDIISVFETTFYFKGCDASFYHLNQMQTAIHILEGKQTYLMVQAMNRASAEEREVLRTTHKNEALNDVEKIATVKALYYKLDVKHATEQQIELRFERALSVLDALSIEKERTVRLAEFARNLMGRKK